MTMSLLRSEFRRALRRRVVWVLVGIALVGCGVLGVIAFVDSAGRTVAEMDVAGEHPALLVDWWTPGADGLLLIAAIPLFIGGMLGGASVAGGEWKAGTVATALTWEPRRRRLHAARAAACFVSAVAIAIVLQVLFFSAALPAILMHGSTAGADADWWLSFAAVGLRIALMTGATALLGMSLATVGRSTTFALGAAFGWMAVGEALVRGLKPGLSRLLVGENVAIVTSWAPLEGAPFTRSGGAAAATLVVYFGVVAVVAAASFNRRDVVGAS